jgi:penicillin-binding protein 1A
LNIFTRLKQFSLKSSKNSKSGKNSGFDAPLPPDSPFDFDPNVTSAGGLPADTTPLDSTPEDSIGQKEPGVKKKKVGSKIFGAAAATGATVTGFGRAVAKPFTGTRPLQKRPLFWGGLTTGAVAIGVGALWVVVDQSVSKYSMRDPLSFAREGTRTYKGADGTKLLQVGSDTSETLKLWQLPDRVKNAFIAIEDRRFYEHDGVDYKGVARAIWTNISTRGLAEGASSITQQVARMVYLDNDKNFTRKLKEVRLAQKIEKEIGKDQILERYLNLVYLGEGAYGVADAAWVYFGKTVDQLNLQETATIAALPPAPNKYSPFKSPKFAQERRNLVLLRMQEAGFISAEEMKTAQAAPLGLKRKEHKQKFQQGRYFTKYVEQEIESGKYLTKEQLALGGLTIETTLNPRWQEMAEEVVQSTVRNNRGSFSQAALVSVDPRSGAIRAMVGGKDFEKNQFNRVVQAKRQPGSTFKPILYTTAIAGGISPNKTYVDAPFQVDNYKPKNAGKSFKGSISMRGALTNSINIVAIKILIDTGFQPVMDLAHKMGIESELKPYYSLALGGLEVNMLEMANAYSTFPTGGMHDKVHSIQRIIDPKGNVLYENKLNPQRILETNNVAIAISLMRGVVTEGTGQNAQLAGRPVAGKTGTTDKERDLWFIGYIPQVVTAVWLGNDNNAPTGNASTTAAYAWGRFMSQAVKDMPVQQFPVPNYDKQKAEIKLDPIRPGIMRTLAVPKDQEGKEGSERGGSSRSDADERPSRSSRRSNRNDDAPRRSRSEESGGGEEAAPRRRTRQAEGGGGGEEAPRRRTRQSEGGGGGEEAPRRRTRQSEGGGGGEEAPRRRTRQSEGGGDGAPRRVRQSEGGGGEGRGRRQSKSDE